MIQTVRRHAKNEAGSRDLIVTPCFWYWVGESNSYCKIENLEY